MILGHRLLFCFLLLIENHSITEKNAPALAHRLSRAQQQKRNLERSPCFSKLF
ncbi:hypothetical protein SGRA_1162 [Saprospira grandis str. Lewin]|uniref:Uncharacterized protein n=1 Tax=Saprospira grandis (strain Lewin) TaxID=984262 RepID=H6L415_SAPGL|nr:hypothetical protein SGRA_1162 [Saprospira grandis str. Lewin]